MLTLPLDGMFFGVDFNPAADRLRIISDKGTTMNQVVIQSPPANGILVATGQLGVDAGPNAGFDIYTQLSRGVAVSNTAFATLAVGDGYWLFHVDLFTGRASRVGRFDENVIDIAFELDQ